MRLCLSTAAAVCLFSGAACAQQPPAQQLPAPALDSMEQKISYIIGLNMGRSMKDGGVPIVPEALLEGLKCSLAGQQPRLSDQDIQQAMAQFEQLMAQREAATQQADPNLQAAAAKNQADGIKFLAENKAREGVKTLPSGLQYKVIQSGTGRTPQATDTVSVHYRGTLIDGTEFDSSVRTGQPATFRVNGVIQGWTEALQLMKEGDKWQLVIPSNLAYKERGTGPIGPNAVLVFDVELLKVQ